MPEKDEQAENKTEPAKESSAEALRHGAAAAVASPESNDLYSDSETFPRLAPRAAKQFAAYLKTLDTLTQRAKKDQNLPKVWEAGLEVFLKQLVTDAFRAQGKKIPSKMEICVSGSLAKQQATLFSDLDTFVLLAREKDKKGLKEVFAAVNNLCYRIFKERNQLCPDPAHINPAKILGTVKEVVANLDEDHFPDTEVALMSLYVSRAIEGNKLCTQLHNELKATFGEQLSPLYFYKKATEDFLAPKKNAEEINIKTHIIRPLDFIMMGLREEYKINIKDGSHLSTLNTAAELRARNLLPKAQIALIESVFKRAMQLRIAAHLKAGQECDDLPISHRGIKQLLSDVALLRTMAKKQITQLETSKDPKALFSGSFFAKPASDANQAPQRKEKDSLPEIELMPLKRRE